MADNNSAERMSLRDRINTLLESSPVPVHIRKRHGNAMVRRVKQTVYDFSRAPEYSPRQHIVAWAGITTILPSFGVGYSQMQKEGILAMYAKACRRFEECSQFVSNYSLDELMNDG